MDSVFEKYAIVEYVRKSDSSLYTVIEQTYTIAQNLLVEIPKTFSNYTIHDIRHSIRVIGYMDTLVKNRLNQFSVLHLMLIVCVGLFHDIGMVVSEDEMQKLYHEFAIRNPSFDKLPEEKKHAYLQTYVRKKHGERVAAMMEHSINNATKIKSLFFVGETKSYDLSGLIATICQSHTESCDWIEENLDRECYYGEYEINPQQIALLLRIGDALDIDDRRAPYMLYELLNPKGVSDDEWRKHIPITNYDKIYQKENMYVILFSGECDDPDIYRKILDYINWIQTDMKSIVLLCAKFKSIYQLDLCDRIETSIKTKGFLATPLTFNLEYQKVSKLLMGERIYGSKQDGLRELLQNAIDAVMLMEEIERSNPYSDYTPIVGIEIDEDTRKVVIFDNGVGMSQRILQNYFFNIGNSYYTSEEFVTGEYMYQPIGHFGIGFLACFMLSSKIRLETRHYQDHEMIIMDFEMDSPYVTRLNGNPQHSFEHGTRIVLDYDQIIPGIFPDCNSIYLYLKDLLAVDDYQMLFIHNGKVKVPLQTFEKCVLSNGEKAAFSYSISKYMNIRFNILNFFEDNENVYFANDWLYDDDPYFEVDYLSLAYFEDLISQIESDYQSEELTWEEAMDSLPHFFFEWLCNNVPDIEDAINRRGLLALFELYINSYIQDSMLSWYELPVICNKHSFNSFLETIRIDGYERALVRYKSDIQWISILSQKPMSNRSILGIVSTHLELNDGTTDVGYFTEYPIQPTKKATRLLKLPGSDYYLRVMKNVHISDSKVYLKGIHIGDESITLPYAIAGIDIERYLLNIYSRDYNTDVARCSLDASSKERLGTRAAMLVYRDIIKNVDLDSLEKSLIECFLTTYYN